MPRGLHVLTWTQVCRPSRARPRHLGIKSLTRADSFGRSGSLWVLIPGILSASCTRVFAVNLWACLGLEQPASNQTALQRSVLTGVGAETGVPRGEGLFRDQDPAEIDNQCAKIRSRRLQQARDMGGSRRGPHPDSETAQKCRSGRMGDRGLA